jgi:hypothetical protein
VPKLIVSLVAAAIFVAAGAQPAKADSPDRTWDTGYGQGCNSTFQYGVYGQYGAWGNYVDGCTAWVQCKYAYCKVSKGEGGLWNNDRYSYWNSSATCNSRLRVLSSNFAVLWHRDGSSSGGPSCRIDHSLSDARYLRRGMWASVQSNGVRAPGDYGARAYSVVELKEWQAPISCYFYGVC